MPIYEYECTSCHHYFDLIQKINDKPEKKCPECLKDTAIKLVSAAGFQLKGNGWYVTDFKNSNTKPKQEQSNSNETTAKAATTDTKSE